MPTKRLFTPGPLAVGQLVDLDDQATRRLRDVIRLRVGDGVVLFDGTGGEYRGVIRSLAAQGMQVALEAFDPVERESPLAVTLLQGLSRGERMDYVAQKSAELGVMRMQPVVTRYTQVRLAPEKASRRQQRWQQIAFSASEQCGRTRVPEVGLPLPFDQALAAVPAGDAPIVRLMLDPDARQSLSGLLAGYTGAVPPAGAVLFIGPEGGLSSQEVQEAEQAGFMPVGMGPRILRTETAPVAALALLQSHWGDLA